MQQITTFREWLSNVLAQAGAKLTVKKSVIFVTQYTPTGIGTRQANSLSLYGAMYNLVYLQLFWGAVLEAAGESYLELRLRKRPIVFAGDPAGVEALASVAKRYRKLVRAKRYPAFLDLLRELGLVIPDDQRSLIIHLWAWAQPKERAIIAIALLEGLAPIMDIERLVTLEQRTLVAAFSAAMACPQIAFGDISARLELLDMSTVEAEVLAELIDASTELDGRTDFIPSMLHGALRRDVRASGSVSPPTCA